MIQIPSTSLILLSSICFVLFDFGGSSSSGRRSSVVAAAAFTIKPTRTTSPSSTIASRFGSTATSLTKTVCYSSNNDETNDNAHDVALSLCDKRSRSRKRRKQTSAATVVENSSTRTTSSSNDGESAKTKPPYRVQDRISSSSNDNDEEYFDVLYGITKYADAPMYPRTMVSVIEYAVQAIHAAISAATATETTATARKVLVEGDPNVNSTNPIYQKYIFSRKPLYKSTGLRYGIEVDGAKHLQQQQQSKQDQQQLANPGTKSNRRTTTRRNHVNHNSKYSQQSSSHEHHEIIALLQLSIVLARRLQQQHENDGSTGITVKTKIVLLYVSTIQEYNLVQKIYASILSTSKNTQQQNAMKGTIVIKCLSTSDIDTIEQDFDIFNTRNTSENEVADNGNDETVTKNRRRVRMKNKLGRRSKKKKQNHVMNTGYVLLVRPTDAATITTANTETTASGTTILDVMQHVLFISSIERIPTIVLSPRFLPQKGIANHHRTSTYQHFSTFSDTTSSSNYNTIGPTPWIIRDFTPPIFSWIQHDNAFGIMQSILHPLHCWHIYERVLLNGSTIPTNTSTGHSNYNSNDDPSRATTTDEMENNNEEKNDDNPTAAIMMNSNQKRKYEYFYYQYVASTNNFVGPPSSNDILQYIDEKHGPVLLP